MYPFNVITINCRDNIGTNVLDELLRIPAHVEKEFPSFDAVVAGSIAGPATRLLIVEVDTTDDIDRLSMLSSRFAGWPILVLTRKVGDQATVFRAMRAGAAQIARLPLTTGDFREAMEAIARQHGFKPHQTQSIAVAGTSGGSGRTTLALNIAFQASRARKLHVVLVDLSLGMGTVNRYLDVQPRFTVYDLLSDMGRVDARSIAEAMTPVADHFELLAGPNTLVDPSKIKADDVLALIDYVRRHCEVAVLNIPPSYDELYLRLLTNSDKVVLVSQQNLPSVANLKVLWDCLRSHDTHQVVVPVINRYDPHHRLTVKTLEEKLHVSGIHTVANDFAAIRNSIDQGKFLYEVSPHSRAVDDINALIEVLMPGRPIPKAKRNFYDDALRLFRRHQLPGTKGALLAELRHELLPEIEDLIRSLPDQPDLVEEIRAKLRPTVMTAMQRILHGDGDESTASRKEA